MCDFFSWIEKGKKLYFLEDKMIEAKWPDADLHDKIGHGAIEEYFKISGGTHKEGALKVPPQIAARINRGAMGKMAKAGGWAGVRYSRSGAINAPWWKPVDALVKECKRIRWLDNHGEVKKTWKVFDTWAAARDAALLARVYASGLTASNKHYNHAQERMEVWRRGYGLYCDVAGALYVYKRVV